MTTTQKLVKVNECDGWDLVCYLNHYNYTNNLPSHLLNLIQKMTWMLQDGYGELGYTPVQGWDWSGIRDSSEERKQDIIKRTLLVLNKNNISEILVGEL